MGFFNKYKTIKKDAKKMFDTLLTPEERDLYREYHEKGDDQAKLQLITEAQERYRKKLEESTGVDTRNIVVELGKNSSMADVINHTLRVLEFDRDGSVIDGDNVKAKSMFKPYGYLIVESPIFNNKAKLPIIHKTDFLLADSVFASPKLAPFIESDELLVVYSPKKVIGDGLSGSPHHALHFILAPRGTLEKYYSIDNDIHFSKPDPKILFGPFVYEGEVKVQVTPGFESPINESVALEKDEKINDNKRTGNFYEYSKTITYDEACDVYKMWLLHIRYYHPKLNVLFKDVSIPTFFLPVPMELLQELPKIIKKYKNEDGSYETEESMDKNIGKYGGRYYPRFGDDEEIVKGLGDSIKNKESFELMMSEIKKNKDDWYFEYKEI